MTTVPLPFLLALCLSAVALVGAHQVASTQTQKKQVVIRSDGASTLDEKDHVERLYDLSCEQVAVDYHQESNKSATKVCADIADNAGDAPCCTSALSGCCADATLCTLEEVYAATDMTQCVVSGTGSSSSGSSGTSSIGSATGDVTCAKVTSDYNADPDKSVGEMCSDIKLDHGVAPCCESQTCCADSSKCTLTEIFTATSMPCTAVEELTKVKRASNMVRSALHAIR